MGRSAAVVTALCAFGACTVPDFGGFGEQSDAGLGGADGSAGSGGSTGGNGGDGGPDASGGSSNNKCKSTADCAGKPATPVCDPATSTCVECLPSDDQCGAGLYCEGTSCSLGCKDNTDCGSLTCDTTSHECTGCSTDPECPTGTVCDVPTKTCIAKCKNQTDCPVNFDCCNEKCENVATSLNHCGACDAACSPANGTGACANGICSVANCDTGFANCDTSPTNGCEININTTASHCGGCGSACSGNNGTPSCSAGKCQIACNQGFVDCDGNALANGCEINVDADPTNCGTCNKVCTPTAPNCVAGSCKSVCALATADCDGNAGNGCETVTKDSHQHCGGCNQPCAGNQYCNSSSCAACPAGKTDCDNDGSNGCEASTASDPNSCGTCGKRCGADGTCGCSSSVCSGGTVYFSEDFSDNSRNWGLAAEWAIGPTQVSSGHEFGGPDPANDHSTTSDNGVAGIVLGGNYVLAIHGYDYLTSPAIDLSSASGSVKLTFWRWLNCDFDTYVNASVEVFDGTTWVTLWDNVPLGENEITEYSWTRYEYDVTAYKNAAFRVRFGHLVSDDFAWQMSGWNVDDLSVSSATCD